MRWTRALYYELQIIICLEKFNFVKLLACVASVERYQGSREKEKGKHWGVKVKVPFRVFLPLPLPYLYQPRRLSNYGIIWGLCFHLVLSEYSNQWHPIISEMWCHHFSSLSENATFGDSTLVHSLYVESVGPYVHILCMFGPKYSVLRTICPHTLFVWS